MKKSFSLSRIMHNDKLMMIVSLVLAIVVWSLVVYGPGNAQDQVITGVPISVTLNDYASQTLNLRIVDGANATATVTVHGLRSVVSKLTASDITITADTGNVIKEGTYTLPLRAVSSGDYSISKVVGDNGTSDTVTISCDVWKEVPFEVSVEMPNLILVDEQNSRFGTPVISSDAVTDGQIVICGAKADVSRVSAVVAVIDKSDAIEETHVYEAHLEARDEQGAVLDTIAFKNAEDSKVSVTVPVQVYRKVDLTPSLLHAPPAYRNSKIVTVTPSSVEVWGAASELEEFASSAQEQIRLDFDQLSPDELTKTVTLQATEGISFVDDKKVITVRTSLRDITVKTLDVPLTNANFTAANVPAGYTVKVAQDKVTGIVLCGTANQLAQVKPENISITVDMSNVAKTGQQSAKGRISIPNQSSVWAYYGKTAHGVDVLLSVEQAK